MGGDRVGIALGEPVQDGQMVERCNISGVSRAFARLYDLGVAFRDRDRLDIIALLLKLKHAQIENASFARPATGRFLEAAILQQMRRSVGMHWQVRGGHPRHDHYAKQALAGYRPFRFEFPPDHQTVSSNMRSVTHPKQHSKAIL